MTHGGKRPGSGRVPSGRKTRNYYLTDAENDQVKDYINKMREGQKNMTPSQYYETTGDSLKGDQQIRAYRAAQNHLATNSPTYLEDYKRIQDKLIVALEEGSMYKVETIGHKNGEYLPGTEKQLYIGKDKDEARMVFDKFVETESITAIGSKLEDDGRWEIIWEK